MFTASELQQIAILINRAQISGQEALPVAMLQQKIAGLVSEQPQEEPKEDLKAEEVKE